MAEKREINRIKRRLSIRFGIGGVVRVAVCGDVSATGMFIRTPNVYPPNSVIRIEFTIADQLIDIEARVMWAKKVPQNVFHLVKKSGMGVRFLRFHSGKEPFYNFFSEIGETVETTLRK